MEEINEALTPGLQELLQYWWSLADHSPAGCSVCRKSFHSECSGLRAATQLLKLLKKLGIYITIQLEKIITSVNAPRIA